MYKYSRSITLFMLFVFSSSLFGVVSTRTGDIKNNSKNSNIPYSFHYKKFQKTIVTSFSNENLSHYGGMHLFLGYGLSDAKEDNCYFVQNDYNKNILNDFDKPVVIENKTYAISRTKMSFSQCKNTAAKYAGYVFSPNGAGIDSEIKKRFQDKDYWIGLRKTSCKDDWINDYNIEQSFNRINEKACDINQLNIISPKNVYWWSTENKNSAHYCLLQIDSKDYLRPIKVCAPWWQIEQTYSIDDEKAKKNLTPFYNIIVPKTYSVCVQYSNNTLQSYQDLYDNKSNWNKYTCTSYYSVKAGASCLENMEQDQCRVNECSGDVEEKCQLLGTFQSDIKKYEIGTFADNSGVMHKGKIKDDIKTFEYLCPPARPSISGCEEFKTVKLFPTDDCNPGGCNTYFECLNHHPDDYSKCDEKKDGCERKYGFEFHVNSSKNVDYAKVKCNDGRIIHNTNINEVSKTSSRCTKYKISKTFYSKTKNCVANKSSSHYFVNAGLTDNDIYMDNNSCVRLNDSIDSQINNYYLEFNASNSFKTKITKVSTTLTLADSNGSDGYTNVIKQIDDGNYSLIVYNSDSNTTSSPSTLSGLSDLFSHVDSIVIGDDNATLRTILPKKYDINKTADSTKEVKFKYFTQEWFNKRLFLFDDPSLLSITRPYSTFAQCVELPIDKSKSSFGTPFPAYKYGKPLAGPAILRENYESNNFMEKTSDQDVLKNGFYCKDLSNDDFVNWYGDSSNELFYNKYRCSRLFDKNGKVWASPIKKRFTYKHKPFYVDATSHKHTVNVTDYSTITYDTKTKCETDTGKRCVAVGSHVVVKFKAYYLSTEHSRTDKYKAEEPSSGKSFDWVTGVSSSSLSSDFLNHMNIDYKSVYDDSSFSDWLDEIFQDYSKDGILHVKNDAEITLEANKYIPTGYSLDSKGMASFSKDVAYYSYTCPSGYTVLQKGYSSYSLEDSEKSKYNFSLFDNINSSTPPAGNCELSNKSYVEKERDRTLSQVVSYSPSGYCNRISKINELSDGSGNYADYNCSKYYGSDGKWDYQYVNYTLYQSTHYKYFRSKNCGYGNKNFNAVSIDGSNSVLLDLSSDETASELSDHIKSYDANLSKELDLKGSRNSNFNIPKDKLTLAGENSSGSNKAISKNLIPLDSKFELFRHNGKIRLISVDNMDSQICKNYYSDINKTRYDTKHQILHSKCIIDVDYFSGEKTKVFTPEENKVNLEYGSFDYNQTGVNNILVVEDYIDGNWGYASNYVSRPFKDAIIKINNKQIFPIKDIDNDLKVKADVNYSRNIIQRGTTTRRRIITAPAAFVGTYIAAAATASPAALAILPASYIINLFGGRKKYTDVDRHLKLYFDDSKYRYFKNIYGYDPRYYIDGKLTSLDMHYVSGTKSKNDGIQGEKNFYASMENLLVNSYGLDKNSFESKMGSYDKTFAAGFPGLKWWLMGPHVRTRHVTYDDAITKNYNMVFAGATNSVTLFVPYKGDYEIIALDKNSNVVGRRFIYSENYISTSNTNAYQQVSFALEKNFNIGSGVVDGNTTHACRFSDVVEWGGGVSGAYYSFGTPKGYTCDKSNDSYVKDHAANFIALRPIGATNFNVIKLKHPLPFANRVFIVTLSKLEKREYECYSDANCTIK